jgi:hypothetical protein
MSLNLEDMRHCHKVLASDIEECGILSEGATGGRAERLQKRMEDDKRVMYRIEGIIGISPEYVPINEETDG